MRERDQEGEERLEATRVVRLSAAATMAALLLPLLLLFTSLAAPDLVASQTNSSFSWRTLSGTFPFFFFFCIRSFLFLLFTKLSLLR